MMTDPYNEDESGNNDELDFAKMLDDYDVGVARDLNIGDPVEGRIISIGASSVYIDTGTKSDGVVDKVELLDENGEFHYKAGDRVKLYVVSVNESEVLLSKALSGVDKASMLDEAFHSKTPVEGKVAGVIKGGFSVDVMGKRAFCPVSQMDVKYVETPEDYLGEVHHFRITRYEEGGRNVVVSRRDLLNEQIEETRNAFLKTVTPGAVIQGTVSKLMPFGAFVELIPGVEGMVHISELSWSRVEKTEEAVRKGEVVTVKLLKVEFKEGGDAPKISLSIKQASGNPWDSLEQTVKEGDQLTGKVIRLAPFGAFVEIAPGIEGLVHLSEMSHTRRVLKADDVVSQGESVQVVVKAVDLSSKRISLSIKDALGDPWNGVFVRYEKGMPVEGTLEKKEKFGLFIMLEPGVIGLMPSSVIANASGSSEYEMKKPGDKVRAVISQVDEEKRRISLAPVGDANDDHWESYAKPENKPMGTMESVLMEALKKQNK